jgi:hypothetical protein
MTFVAAGVTAAELAAMEAAAVAAAEIAATEAAAATAATEAAAASAPSILQAAAPEILAPEILTPGMGQGITTPMGIDQIVPGTGAEVLPPAGSQPLQLANAPSFEGVANIKPPTVGLDQSGQLTYQGTTPGLNVPPPPTPSGAPIQPTTFNPNLSYSSQVQSPYNMTGLPQVDLAQGMSGPPTFEAPQSSLNKGFDSALNFMNNNKFLTGTLAVAGLNAMGAFDPNQSQMPDKKYSGSLSRYRMSPNFQPSRATPNVYTPRYAAQGGIMMAAGGTYDDEPMSDDMGMAMGGIASYSRGRSVRRASSQDELNDYMKMMEGEAPEQAPAPSYVGSTGIIPLDNMNTRYKDALNASMIRMGEAGSRANYTPYSKMQRPNALGGINLSAPGVKKEAASSSDDERDAAAGGIMQADKYNMGGYASGSVPRLLKGPGDGMSDNIPASIDGRQPARLADGEFVIPADVVSGLGNGSTEAGAKHLHKMMTDVRKARTGNPKQGKEIVAQKYLPKKKRA